VLSGIAAEGMGLMSEREVLIADDAQSFAEAVIRLYSDPDLWKRLSTSSVAFARRDLSETRGLSNIAQMLSAMREDWAALCGMTPTLGVR
jgi:O-antigen biosynthesis protein